MSAFSGLKKILGYLLNNEIAPKDKEIILKQIAGVDTELSKMAKSFTMIDLGSWLEKHIPETFDSLTGEQIQEFNTFGNAAMGSSLIHYMRLNKSSGAHMDAWIGEKILSLVDEDKYSVSIIAEFKNLLDSPKLNANLSDILGLLLVRFFESHDSFPHKDILAQACMKMYGDVIKIFDNFLNESWQTLQATLIFSKPAVNYSRELNLYLLKDFKSNSSNYLGLLHTFGG